MPEDASKEWNGVDHYIVYQRDIYVQTCTINVSMAETISIIHTPWTGTMPPCMNQIINGIIRTALHLRV